MTGRARGAVLGLAGVAGFAVLLEATPRLLRMRQDVLPPLSAILSALAGEVGTAGFWQAVADTLQQWALGLAIAVAAGATVGVLIGSVPLLRRVTASTIEFLRPIPSVALIPLAVLLYGTGIRATLLLVVYAAFWQVLVQVLHGVGDVDPVARDTADSYRLGRLARMRYLVWPTALPYALTGVRLATSVALVLAVTGELVIGTPGLGREIAVAQSSGAVPAMYALVVVTGLLGVAANLVTRAAERRALVWHPAVRT